MPNLRLWMRIGDAGEYESFDTVGEAAEELHAHLDPYDDCAGHYVTRYAGPALVGVEVDWLAGDDAVSFYWGDDDAQLVSPIEDKGMARLREILA